MDILDKQLYEHSKRYFSISEVAAMFDVAQSLLRFWEVEFTSLKLSKNRKGDRLYTEKNIDHLRLIYHLVKEKGFTLDGARNELGRLKSKVDKKQKLLKELTAVKTRLELILKEF